MSEEKSPRSLAWENYVLRSYGDGWAALAHSEQAIAQAAFYNGFDAGSLGARSDSF